MNITGSAHLAQSHGLDNYHDLGALQTMRHQSAGDDASRLKAVAQQFESMFVSLMIKSMRDANKVFGEGNMLSSQHGEFFEQMYDSQLAVTLSSGRGIGLAQVIEQQLAKGRGAGERAGQSSPEAFSMQDYFERPFPVAYAPKAIDEVVARVEEQVAQLPEHEAQTLAHPEPDFSSPDSFIASLYPLARQVEAETGIDARVMIAQSALETGWGQHQILREDGQPSFNLFGIKAQHDWSGERATITTTEYRNGVPVKEQAAFRAYDSFADSFRDYAEFLQSQPRYAEALDQLDDPTAFASALQQAGYATDPNYANKINSILNRYLLAEQGAVSAPVVMVK